MNNLHPTQWNTVADKEKFIKHFKSFVQKGFTESMFNQSFYNRMSMMRGHIAHYNRGGFYETWFSTSEKRAGFLSTWTRQPCNGDPTFTWSDAERILADWIRDNPQYEEKEHTHTRP